MTDPNEIARRLSKLRWRVIPQYQRGYWEVVAEPFDWDLRKRIGKTRPTGFKYRNPNSAESREKILEIANKIINHYEKD